MLNLENTIFRPLMDNIQYEIELQREMLKQVLVYMNRKEQPKVKMSGLIAYHVETYTLGSRRGHKAPIL